MEASFIAHPIMNPRLGIESSNGSLGQDCHMVWASFSKIKK